MSASSSAATNPNAAGEGEQAIGFGKSSEGKKKQFKKPYPKKDANADSQQGDKKNGGDKKKQNNNPNANPNEPYIVIIKNAENDLCRIHENALPQFLGLNLMNQEKRRAGASYYDVKIRSETRTGEITFHGHDESAFFRAATTKPTGKVNINKKPGQKREREEGEEEAAPAVDPASEGEATAASEPAEARFSTIADMMSFNASRPYYNSHLTYTHTTGNDASTSLMGKLVGAVAEVNQKMNPKGLRKILKDVPGFLSCWFIKATGPTTTQFRVVFNSEAELLSAKEMLDQFEAVQGVRVSLKLSDNLGSKFQKFLLEKAGGGGGATSDDVVAINPHNEDYE